MGQVCILTDSTAQFVAPNFSGHELVNVIPLHVQFEREPYAGIAELKTAHLPASLGNGPAPQVQPPSAETFRQVFTSLGRRYRDIVTILVSSHLNDTVANAVEAAETVKAGANIHIVDSQAVAVGLGLLVQEAAAAAQRELPAVEITRLIRSLVPHVYAVFCVQSLTYLSASGHLDPAQALVGEMMGITPFLILENGRLVSIQKIRSARHLVDLLHEFITEFIDLKHVALLQGVPPFEQEVRNLRERLNSDYPDLSFSEHTLNAALASILGPRSLGVVVMEDASKCLT
jgi:DegV family protein with EDD domain